MKIISLYKNAFSSLPKNIWLLSLVMLINRSGTMVIAFLTLYCTQHLHWSANYAGIAVGVYGLGAILGALIGGKLSDKIGYQKIQITALIGAGVFFIATSFATTYLSFYILIFCLACVNESFRPANTSAIAANSNEISRTRSFALLRLAMNLGWSIGTTIGGFLSQYNYQLLFWVDGVTSICAGIAMLFLKFKPMAKTVTASINNNDKSPYNNKPFLLFIAGTLLFTFCFFQLFSNLPLFYKIGLHLDETIIGIILAINGILIALFEMLIINNIENRFSKKRIIIIGTLGMAAFFAISCGMYFINALLLAFGGMLLITFAEMLSLPFMNSYYLSFAGKNNIGKYAAIYTMSWSIGQILAGYVGGSIIYNFGFIPLWSVCAILSVTCAFIYYKVMR